jgi:DNA topoisomerase-1
MTKESALNKKVKVSPELAEFVGASEISRADVTKKVWEYIKSKNLQDPNDKRTIKPDTVLSKLIGSEPINMMKMTGVLNKHFIK